MQIRAALSAAVMTVSPLAVQAEDSAIALGRSAYGALCAVCHGDDAKGGGEVAELFEVKPPDLTKLAERAGGSYPFSEVYEVIVLGMEAPGHGASEMPIWGDYFVADALEDRGVSRSDAVSIAAGRALSLTYYLETLQE
ncbi:cytochrome c [Rhodosalinus sp. FB01]|uniref:c-type cytochrome n=1 Tax=Rhodosalinus sp. FB01 TaxID=3239194 RepID=UPI003524061B